MCLCVHVNGRRKIIYVNISHLQRGAECVHMHGAHFLRMCTLLNAYNSLVEDIVLHLSDVKTEWENRIGWWCFEKSYCNSLQGSIVVMYGFHIVQMDINLGCVVLKPSKNGYRENEWAMMHILPNNAHLNTSTLLTKG